MFKKYEDENIKIIRSENYNYNFIKKNGYFERWGKTKEDDPQYSIYGNEILDIEITDICNGPGGIPCKFCYKSNTPNNKNNMSFNMFKNIIDKMPDVITQIAIGADAQCTSNPDVWKMMEYSRSKDIVPNITVADISDETANKLVKYCGAVAVSRYDNKNYCYDSIKKLTDRGMNQLNIHILASQETFNQIYETFNDYIDNEERLKGLNAIVLLSLKQKGRGKSFNPLDQESFKYLVDYALNFNIPIGFDSCSCNKFLNSIKDRDDYKELEMLSDPCESSCFSAYINCKGNFFPCSFAEGQDEWKEGISVTSCNDFIKDVWMNDKVKDFRNNLLNNNRNCPLFKV